MALLAVGVNGHTLATGIHRRRHDIAVSALGLTPRQCPPAIFTQATTVAATGLLLGIPLGLALGRILWRVVADITPVLYAPPLALQIALLTIPAALALAALLAFRPTRHVTRYSVSDCLRTG
ncbi:FtsX-like permease family protein [Acrocarpospora corrugata]|uniref:FtsX-like permease family protein n=1 Tax=Acrocarpospora corrugata TaxID=35763 RepID=UPI003BEF0371